jgi:hypothetical protein
MPPADPPDGTDGWDDEPDAWEETDRAWEARWSDDDPPPDETAPPDALDPVAERTDSPPPSGYRPRRATAGGTTGAYGDGMRAAGPYLGLGLQIGLAMVLFAGGGILVDRWLDSSPWGVIAGVALGMVGIVVLVLRVAREGA